jgi:hypothetical protein
MPKIAYEPNVMRPDAMAIAVQAAEIAAEYAGNGYDLTLRQIYYQFVGRGLTADWPTGHNTERSYKRLGSIVDKARMCGLIDWHHITDRTRGLAGPSHWDTPADIINSSAWGYKIDKWEGQPRRVEIWVEKEALAGIIGQVSRSRDVDYLACKGFLSSSAMWRSARRIGQYAADGIAPTVLHLGDHDPSGIDMSRDNEDRLFKMIRNDYGLNAALSVEFRRIALNMNQVEQYNPPPNPAKATDSRYAKYREEHGHESWELDALPPDVLVDLMNSHIDGLVDAEMYAAREAVETADRARLRLAADNWSDVADYVATSFGGE